MFQSTLAKVAAALAAAELLIVALLLPSGVLSLAETWVALVGYLLAWGVAMVLGARSFSAPEGRASTLVQWPAITLSGIWALGSGAVLGAAVTLSMKWIIGLHGVAALICFVVATLMRGAGAHMDAVESEVAKSDDAHADLHSAIAKARLAISRANLDPSVAQKARTLLDKAQALPRSSLSGIGAQAVLEKISELVSARESHQILDATCALESALTGMTA